MAIDDCIKLDSQSGLIIADVAVTKHHQRLDELFLPVLYRKSAKLFTRKLYQKHVHL